MNGCGASCKTPTLAAKNAARMGHPAATIGRVVQDRESLKAVAGAGNSIVFMAGITRLYTGSDQLLALGFQLSATLVELVSCNAWGDLERRPSGAKARVFNGL